MSASRLIGRLALAIVVALALSGAALAIAGWRLAGMPARAQALAASAARSGQVPWAEARALATEAWTAVHVARLASYPWRPLLWAAPQLRVAPEGVAQAGAMLDLAAPLADAGMGALAAGEEISRALEGDGAQPVGAIGPRLTRGLDAAAEELASLRDPLARAARARAAVRPETLTGRLAPAALLVSGYDRTLGSHPAVLALALDAPSAWRWLAGVDGERTYRVLGQNSDELRATGGFIASAGEVTVRDGALTRVHQGNPADLDDPRRAPTEPPRPLREFMGLGSWHLQDANWWADFPTAAAQAGAFWREGPPSSGTLAADDGALARLVGALGPIRLEGVPQPVTPESLPELIATYVYAGATDWSEGIALQQRKSTFLAQLFSALLERALEPPPDRRAALLAAVLEAFRSKELLLTLDDPRWAAALSELGWDGGLNQEPGDLVYLVESTVSYTKLGRRMQTEVAHSVELDDRAEVRRSRLTLRVRNPFSTREVPSMYPAFYFALWWNPATRREETHMGRYAGYYRVYVPEGTTLLGGTGWDAPLDYLPPERGRSVVGGYLVVDPLQTREVTLDLVPPPGSGASGGTYRLAVPRQPSAPTRPVRVEVALPASLRARDAIASGGGGTSATVRTDDSGRTRMEWRLPGDADATIQASVAPRLSER